VDSGAPSLLGSTNEESRSAFCYSLFQTDTVRAWIAVTVQISWVSAYNPQEPAYIRALNRLVGIVAGMVMLRWEFGDDLALHRGRFAGGSAADAFESLYFKVSGDVRRQRSQPLAFACISY